MFPISDLSQQGGRGRVGQGRLGHGGGQQAEEAAGERRPLHARADEGVPQLRPDDLVDGLDRGFQHRPHRRVAWVPIQ